MNNYFTLDNYRKHFSVIINDNNVIIFRIENRDKIWEGEVKDIFIGKSCLNEMTEFSGARDDSIWDGNTILLKLDEKKYMFIGNSGIYSFETEDNIIKFTSNVGNNCVPYAVSYGEKNIYYMNDTCQFIPYDSIQDNDIRKKISNMDESYEPYEFLYDTNEGERIKFHSFIMIARRYEDSYYERFLNDENNEIDQEEIDEEDVIFENKFYNGTNELVKIFNQKCVICIENDSIYAFRQCGHLCLCEVCYNSEITKCVVCRT